MYNRIGDFKKNYRSRTDVVKDEKGDLVTHSFSIVARWRNYFSLLWNVHGVNDVRQRQIHTAEPLLPELSASDVELAIEKLKIHKSPGIVQIPAELIKAGGGTICYEIHKHLISIWNRRNCLRSGRSQSLYLSVRGAIIQIVLIIGSYHFSHLCTKFYPTSCCEG